MLMGLYSLWFLKRCKGLGWSLWLARFYLGFLSSSLCLLTDLFGFFTMGLFRNHWKFSLTLLLTSIDNFRFNLLLLTTVLVIIKPGIIVFVSKCESSQLSEPFHFLFNPRHMAHVAAFWIKVLSMLNSFSKCGTVTSVRSSEDTVELQPALVAIIFNSLEKLSKFLAHFCLFEFDEKFWST
jgi:hypothetical protein